MAVFLFGIVVGALSFATLARRRSAARDPHKALQQLYREFPPFFDELRAEIKKPEFRQVREFAILESSRETFVSEDLRLVFYEEDIAGLKSVAAALEEIGFTDDVSRGKQPIFRLRENFIDALKAL
jgi:hypothetical protein